MAQNSERSASKNGKNSDGSAIKRRRGRGRPFAHGISGNPGGRPRADLDVQALAREHTSEAIATLVNALTDGRHCVAAANSLLDRGWGKPREHVQLDGTSRVTSVVLHIVAAGDEPSTIDGTPGVITITTGAE